MSKSSEPGNFGQLAAKCACARPVDRAVDDDPVQPRPERTAPVETVEVAQRGQERLLRDVLRGGRVLDDEIGGPVRPGPVLAKQRLEVRDRSRSGAPYPGALLPAGAHHALTIRASSGTRSIRGPGAERSGDLFASGEARTRGHETPTPTPRASGDPVPLGGPRRRLPALDLRDDERRTARVEASRSSSRTGGRGRSGPTTSDRPQAIRPPERHALRRRQGFRFSRPGAAQDRFVRYDTRTGRGRPLRTVPGSGAWSESRRTAAGSRASSFGRRAGDRSSRWTDHGRSGSVRLPGTYELESFSQNGRRLFLVHWHRSGGYDLQQYDRAQRAPQPDEARRARREDDRPRNERGRDS